MLKRRPVYTPPPAVVAPPLVRPAFDVKLVKSGHSFRFVTCYPMQQPRLIDRTWPAFCHTTKNYDRLSEVENKGHTHDA